MGITGLLPFLEAATRQCHVSEFRGGTVAVDSYCWLHKGANACAEQLASGVDNQMYVRYCMKYVNMLLNQNIHVIMVFDGRNLPAKSETELKRRQGRKVARQRAMELLRLGKTEEARNYFRQCVDITPQMALNLINECRKANVDCIVAPYESDAQLAYFDLNGKVDFIITEDSDLILFGCKKVLYKLDLTGRGQLVESEHIYKAMNLRPDKYTFEKFRHMCILSGCDYLSSLHGIGLKKALKFVTLTAETDPVLFLDKVPRYLNMRHLTMTDEYKVNFMIAEATFRHQIVFDPVRKQLKPLTDPETCGTKPEYCINAGEIYDQENALQVALGNLHPKSFEKLADWTPNTNILTCSIWAGRTKPLLAKKEIKMQEKVLKVEKFEVQQVDEEQIQEEIDNETKLILQFYTKAEVKPKIEEEPVEPIEPRPPSKFTNPFLKDRKISKFPLTIIDNTTTTRSCYFAKNHDLRGNSSDPEENGIEMEIPETPPKTPTEDVTCTPESPSKRQLSLSPASKENIVMATPEKELPSPMKPKTKEASPRKSLRKLTNTQDKKRKLRPSLGNLSKKPKQQTLFHFFNKKP